MEKIFKQWTEAVCLSTIIIILLKLLGIVNFGWELVFIPFYFLIFVVLMFFVITIVLYICVYIFEFLMRRK